uniref:TonB-dependent receptor n=1 Tax=uncultured Draconibacterium sp. TaxID=1573823 RepID=UPI003216E81B
MRLTLFLIFVNVLGVFGSTYSQQARFNFSYKNASIKQVLDDVKKQSEFEFFYSNDDFDVNKEVTLKVKNGTVEEILEKIIDPEKMRYRVVDNIVIISTKNSTKEEDGKQQQKEVTGTVSDNKGLPLPGVAVIIQGTAQGTVTGTDGKYKLEVPKGTEFLEFSFVGMKRSVVSLKGRAVVDVILSNETIGIDEVVVVGYGTMRKSDLTGSVASVKMEEIKDKDVTSVEQMLQGNLTGVRVVSNSGLPGSGLSVRIRGVGTLNNTDPLYVIDGLPFRNGSRRGPGNPMALINPDDISSIEVLKDAAATAIYGSSGANGVILITTKKGKKGEPVVSFNTSFGISEMTERIDLINAKQHVELLKDIIEEDPNSVLPAKFSDMSIVGVDRTNWQDEMFRKAFQQKYNVAVNGGTDDLLYNFSLGYTDEEGVVLNTDFERISFRSNVELKLNDFIKIGENFTVAHVRTKRVPGDNGSVIQGALRMPTYLEVEDKNNLGGYSIATHPEDLCDPMNPVTTLTLSDNNDYALKLMGNLFGEIQFSKNLKLRSSFGVDLNRGHQRSFGEANVNGSLTFISEQVDSHSWGNNITVENVFTYTNNFKDHDFVVLAGNSYSKGEGSWLQAKGSDFSNYEVYNIGLAKKLVIEPGYTGNHVTAKLGYFGRVNYSYKNKYLFQANFRADGSDRFAPGNRWAYFKSFSGGWKLSEESFIKDNIKAINLLKLRIGYGESGNDLINEFRYYANLSSRSVYYFGSEKQGGVTINSMSTPDIQWETTETTNVGLDLNLFDNKFQFTGEYFIKNTKDILIDVPTPASMGLGDKLGGGGSPIRNAANVENKGLELSLAYNNSIGKFNYGVSGNITFIKGEVTSLGDQIDADISYLFTRTEKGQPIGSFYGHVVDKVYSTQAEVDNDNAIAVSKGFDQYQEHAQAGDIRFKDLNGDGTITDADRTFIGDPEPDYTYGFNLFCDYKGFDLSFNFSGVQGNEIYCEYKPWIEGMVRPGTASTVVLDRWKKEGDITSVPRAVSSDPAKNERISDRWIEDGSYLKLRTVSLGYNVSKAFLEKYLKNYISSCRINLSANNVFTISDYPGYDPEVGNRFDGSSNMTRGIDYCEYPQPRSIVFGVKVEF